MKNKKIKFFISIMLAMMLSITPCFAEEPTTEPATESNSVEAEDPVGFDENKEGVQEGTTQETVVEASKNTYNTGIWFDRPSMSIQMKAASNTKDPKSTIYYRSLGLTPTRPGYYAYDGKPSRYRLNEMVRYIGGYDESGKNFIFDTKDGQEALQGKFSSSETSDSHGVTVTTFCFSVDNYLLPKIVNNDCPQWRDDIISAINGTNEKEEKLQLDTCLAVHYPGKYPYGGWSGYFAATYGDPQGLLWTMDNWNSETGIHTAAPWRYKQPSAWQSYYNQILTFNSFKTDVEPVPDPEPPTNKYTVIGKNEPQYYAYNYATDGEFHLNKNANGNVTEELYGVTDKAQATDAIPATEKITNGYQADKWYGTADLNTQSVSKSWTFHGRVEWKEDYEYIDTQQI